MVQIEPGPIPIFTTLAPESISAFVPSGVATLPPKISTELLNLDNSLIVFNTFLLCP